MCARAVSRARALAKPGLTPQAYVRCAGEKILDTLSHAPLHFCFKKYYSGVDVTAIRAMSVVHNPSPPAGPEFKETHQLTDAPFSLKRAMGDRMAAANNADGNNEV